MLAEGLVLHRVAQRRRDRGSTYPALSARRIEDEGDGRGLVEHETRPGRWGLDLVGRRLRLGLLAEVWDPALLRGDPRCQEEDDDEDGELVHRAARVVPARAQGAQRQVTLVTTEHARPLPDVSKAESVGDTSP